MRLAMIIYDKGTSGVRRFIVLDDGEASFDHHDIDDTEDSVVVDYATLYDNVYISSGVMYVKL
jgi:hypothetical protein